MHLADLRGNKIIPELIDHPVGSLRTYAILNMDSALTRMGPICLAYYYETVKVILTSNYFQ